MPFFSELLFFCLGKVATSTTKANELKRCYKYIIDTCPIDAHWLVACCIQASFIYLLLTFFYCQSLRNFQQLL